MVAPIYYATDFRPLRKTDSPCLWKSKHCKKKLDLACILWVCLFLLCVCFSLFTIDEMLTKKLWWWFFFFYLINLGSEIIQYVSWCYDLEWLVIPAFVCCMQPVFASMPWLTSVFTYHSIHLIPIFLNIKREKEFVSLHPQSSSILEPKYAIKEVEFLLNKF